jgi:hypothetical protein
VPAAAEVAVLLAGAGGGGYLRPAEARDLCRAADQLSRKNPVAQPRARIAAARLALLDGKRAPAVKLIEAARVIAGRVSTPMEADWCRRALAAIAAGNDDALPDVLT